MAEAGSSEGTTGDGGAAAALARWRVDEAVAARRRVWWSGRQAEASASLAGVLLDLAEQGRVVALTVAGGRVRTGRLWGVGPGVVGVRSRGELDVVLRLAAVVALQPGPAAGDGSDRAGGGVGGAPVGDRTVRAPGDGSFAEALAGLADERPEVQVLAADGVVAEGRLEAVGTDVARITTASGVPRWVALEAVTEVVLRAP